VRGNGAAVEYPSHNILDRPIHAIVGNHRHDAKEALSFLDRQPVAKWLNDAARREGGERFSIAVISAA
jgi:hypothetical protein